MVPAARRLDCIGLLARGVDDLGVLLHLLAGYDADDPRSRRRHVDLALPDWEPGKLRAGVLGDLTAFGTEPAVAAVFAKAMDTLKPELGECRIVDFGGFPMQRARRAAFFLIEAEMLVTHAAALADGQHPVSPELDQLLAYAGVHPAERSSGRKGANPETSWHMSKAGNAHLRAAAYRMAVVGIQHNPVIRAHYERKRAAGKSKMNALGHCMRKALSLVWGVWRNGQDFDPNWGLEA
jgi:Asp-tRNA(Asn)/Glu-tRNA(Gln) amidotransferase A subunit family amidase